MFAEIIDGEVYKYYSDGEWKKATSGKSVAIINPTTRKTQYRVQGERIVFLFFFSRIRLSGDVLFLVF